MAILLRLAGRVTSRPRESVKVRVAGAGSGVGSLFCPQPVSARVAIIMIASRTLSIFFISFLLLFVLLGFYNSGISLLSNRIMPITLGCGRYHGNSVSPVAVSRARTASSVTAAPLRS